MHGVPEHATADSAYETVYTVIHDLGQGEDIAWIRGAVWPPVGTVVELGSPERHALVVGIRLVLEDGSTALVRVDVQDHGEGELIARDAATRVLAEDAVPSTGEALLEADRTYPVLIDALPEEALGNPANVEMADTLLGRSDTSRSRART